jgi:hypothetical protein
MSDPSQAKRGAGALAAAAQPAAVTIACFGKAPIVPFAHDYSPDRADIYAHCFAQFLPIALQQDAGRQARKNSTKTFLDFAASYHLS